MADEAVTNLVKSISATLGQMVSSTSRGAWTVGAVTPINNLGTSSIQVIGPDPNRVALVFHNPGTIDILVAQSGTTPSFTSRGGSWIVLAGNTVTLVGNVKMAWNAIAQSGSNNPLTVSSAII